MDFLSRFFNTSGFPPRWKCGSGWADNPALGWIHIFSDLAIFGAYFAIPWILIYFVFRRKSIPFRMIFLLFGAFILLCGTTHLMDALIFWWPAYPVAGIIKFATAVVSWATVLALIKTMPEVLAMRSQCDLEREIEARNQAEHELRLVNDKLESRVSARTAEIAGTLRELKDVKAALDEHAIVAITDKRGRITYVNDKFCAISKYARKELLGRDHRIINSGFHSKEFIAGLWQTIGSGKVWKGEIKNRAKDGSFYWVNTTIVPYLREDGKPVQFVAIRTDITARKNIEADRLDLLERERTARMEAEGANRAKDEFLATVSHELRTPLTPILGWTRLLREGHLDGATSAQALEIIERNVNMQAHLIEDLLDVSRIITGKLRLERQLVDLAHVIEAAIETMRTSAVAKGILINTHLDSKTCQVNGDQSRLLQVVWNLLANAVKFSSKDGVIDIELRASDDHALIIVKDSGEGISPEFLPRVFQRFQQAEMNSTRTHSGLGLGLAIVRHLVEMHGGSAHVESPGKGLGATFTISLPLAAVSTRPKDSAIFANRGTPMDSASLSGLKILVVDDEKDTRDILAFTLTSTGAEVTLANSAEQALSALSKERFDLLLSDIGMPGRDGYDLIKAVRALKSNEGGEIPAIALTAFARDEDRGRAIAAGFQIHMPKPVEPALLVSAISDMIPRSKKSAMANTNTADSDYRRADR